MADAPNLGDVLRREPSPLRGQLTVAPAARPLRVLFLVSAHNSLSQRAYIALTKPRIIELLLVTTVPAMVLATRWVPGLDWVDWGWLVLWTLIGGTLAAGSANAINCYLDRDIDGLMTRTRRRPLPAHQVAPERAVVFGIVLGVLSFVVMAWFVNLLAAYPGQRAVRQRIGAVLRAE